MPQKITELQNQLEKIIKGKKDITDKILMSFWKMFLVSVRQRPHWH